MECNLHVHVHLHYNQSKNMSIIFGWPMRGTRGGGGQGSGPHLTFHPPTPRKFILNKFTLVKLPKKALESHENKNKISCNVTAHPPSGKHL